jgi:hypothetical protein
MQSKNKNFMQTIFKVAIFKVNCSLASVAGSFIGQIIEEEPARKP